MRNFQAQLNFNVCKVMTGKHMFWGLFLNKVAAMQLHLNETLAQVHLFAEHLQKTVSVVFFS